MNKPNAYQHNAKHQVSKKRGSPDLFVKNLRLILILVAISMLVTVQNLNEANALTQFYIALPDIIYDLSGITLSVEISDYKNSPIVSWTHNGSAFVPDNGTNVAEPNYGLLHLDNNNFLLAINETVDPGTRLYICADVPYPKQQYDCQWDAVDKNQTGYAEFDFYFQSHKDIK